jgi:hypothetical protein
MPAPTTTSPNPFGMDEFLARLRAAVRRSAAASDTDEPVIETSSFTVDLAVEASNGHRKASPQPKANWPALVCVPMQMSIHAVPSLSTRLHRSRGHSGIPEQNNAVVKVTAPATCGAALRPGVVDSIKQMHARELR